ncbi:lipoprotein [Psychromonas marina]|uniref:Lipoprotein n=1 Tax=Psychromonas marina TaxID=88364 RepID=A0ABQ6DWZ3_9GAMM|nr:hypothetical protein [Psychromonas marina]GLS89639.1 lipoprotein [Psychromonas marina]
MLKKIFFLSSVLFLSACATNPEGMSSEQFANNAKLTTGYNVTEVIGEKIRLINLTHRSRLQVLSSDATLRLKIGDQETSTLIFNLQFLENQQRYAFASINNISQKAVKRQETVRQCDEQCSVTQYMILNIKTDELKLARESGLIFSINNTATSTDFTFKLPSNYIDGLFKRYEKEKSISANITPVVIETSAQKSKAIEMSQYWFNELDSEEQITFSTWSITNSKQQSSIADGSKALQMVRYWYQKATAEEQKKLRIWAVGNMK